LRDELAASGGDTLRQMAARWPFFATLLSMQGMVLIKADSGLSAYYDKRLVPGELRSIGEELRELLAQDARTLESLLREREFTPEQRWGMESIALRNIYTDPLNYLQVESLARKRHGGGAQIDLAVMVTIAGIAAGMRNTG